MGKDAYYFSHDSNAHTDPRILKLRMALGWEGYGIYWAIIENLRNQENYSICESEFMFLTLSLAIDEAKLKQMLSKCLEVKLLKLEDGKVFSPSLLRRMEKADAIREKRREAGSKGGKAKASAKQMPQQNPSEALALKETKEKETKERKEKIESADWLDSDLFYAFLDVRKSLGVNESLTDKSVQLILNELLKNRSIANEALEKSIKQNSKAVDWSIRAILNNKKSSDNSNLSTRP